MYGLSDLSLDDSDGFTCFKIGAGICLIVSAAPCRNFLFDDEFFYAAGLQMISGYMHSYSLFLVLQFLQWLLHFPRDILIQLTGSGRQVNSTCLRPAGVGAEYENHVGTVSFLLEACIWFSNYWRTMLRDASEMTNMLCCSMVFLLSMVMFFYLYHTDVTWSFF